MFDVGTQEILVILLLVLVLFGPRRLPEIGRAIGKAVRELKKTVDEVRETLEQEPPEELRKEVEKKLLGESKEEKTNG